MNTSSPLVSIGIPVFNGENFLKYALDSILAQTFEDFELIISDNASTDRTEKICREYAVNDRRIRYYRNELNIGAAPNYNQVFELSRGKYFKWLAHDDLCAPTFLDKGVSVLEQDSSVVLCYSLVSIINGEGQPMKKSDKLYDWVRTGTVKLNTGSFKAHERFREIMRPHPCYQIFGLMRADSLKQTPLIESYASSDRVLLSKLVLMGRFCELPEYLLLHRRHSQQSIEELRSHRSPSKYSEWFDPSTKGKLLLPRWRVFYEIIKTIENSPYNWKERMSFYRGMTPWLRRSRRGLIKDLEIALRQALK